MKYKIRNCIILSCSFLLLHVNIYSQNCPPALIDCFRQPGAPHLPNQISTNYYLSQDGYTAVLVSQSIVKGVQCYWEFRNGVNWIKINGGINKLPVCVFKIGKSGYYRLSFYCYTDPFDPTTLQGELHSSPMHIILQTPPCGLKVFSQPSQILYEGSFNDPNPTEFPSLASTCYEGFPENTIVKLCSNGSLRSFHWAKLSVSVESDIPVAINYYWTSSTEIISSNSVDNIIVSPAVNTTYTCTVTGANGCVASTTIQVIKSNPGAGGGDTFQISTQQDSYYCEGEQIQLCTSGADRLFWQNQLSQEVCTCFKAAPVPDCTPDNLGQNSVQLYNILGWDTNGCSVQQNFRYYIASKPEITIGSYVNNLCQTTPPTPVTLSVTNYPNCSYQYNWTLPGNNTATGNQIVVYPINSSNTYTINVDNIVHFLIYGEPNTKTCSFTGQATINVYTPINLSPISASSTSICDGDRLTLSVTGGQNQCIWSSIPFDPTLIIQSCGNAYANPHPSTNGVPYIYSFSTINGSCSASASTVPIMVNPLPSVLITPSDPNICPDGNITLTAQADPPTNYLTFLWNSGPNTQNYNVFPSNTTTYIVSGQDNNGCVSSASSTVIVYPRNTVGILSDKNKFCLNSHDVINLQASGADINQNYSWSPSTGLSSNTVSGVECNTDQLINTSTKYTVTSIDINNCPISGTIEITNLGDCGKIISCDKCISTFSPIPGRKYVISAWVKETNDGTKTTYSNPIITLNYNASLTGQTDIFGVKGDIIDGWQKIEEEFTIPMNASDFVITLSSRTGGSDVYFDDIRVFPKEGSMKSFVYDPESLRLVAELDDNNYATFYEYDEDGALVRVKKETERGVVTVKESRNSIHKKY